MNKWHIQTTTHLLCSSADALSSVNVLRLEWQRIHRIENLDFFTNLTDLYLQHNQIEVIENLDAHVCPQLSFLALANNKIRRVENIVHLWNRQTPFSVSVLSQTKSPVPISGSYLTYPLAH